MYLPCSTVAASSEQDVRTDLYAQWDEYNQQYNNMDRMEMEHECGFSRMDRAFAGTPRVFYNGAQYKSPVKMASPRKPQQSHPTKEVWRKDLQEDCGMEEMESDEVRGDTVEANGGPPMMAVQWQGAKMGVKRPAENSMFAPNSASQNGQSANPNAPILVLAAEQRSGGFEDLPFNNSFDRQAGTVSVTNGSSFPHHTFTQDTVELQSFSKRQRMDF